MGWRQKPLRCVEASVSLSFPHLKTNCHRLSLRSLRVDKDGMPIDTDSEISVECGNEKTKLPTVIKMVFVMPSPQLRLRKGNIYSSYGKTAYCSAVAHKPSELVQFAPSLHTVTRECAMTRASTYYDVVAFFASRQSPSIQLDSLYSSS